MSDDQFIVYIKAKRIYMYSCQSHAYIYIYQLIAFIEKKDTLALLIYKYVKILSIIDGFIYVRIHTRWINN